MPSAVTSPVYVHIFTNTGEGCVAVGPCASRGVVDPGAHTGPSRIRHTIAHRSACCLQFLILSIRGLKGPLVDLCNERGSPLPDGASQDSRLVHGHVEVIVGCLHPVALL